MKAKLMFLIFLTLWISSFTTAQIISYDWNVKEPIKNQVHKFENGQIWIENIEHQDTFWRYEFTAAGTLRIKAQITQVVFGDTIIKFDEDLYAETYTIIYYKEDILNGRFIKYFDNGKIKAAGNYLNGRKFGDWKEYFITGDLKKTITYNRKGKKEGAYIEYYKNRQIKESGSYAIEKILKNTNWFDPETYEDLEGAVVFEFEIKKGLWQYFSKDGRLWREVEYE